MSGPPDDDEAAANDGDERGRDSQRDADTGIGQDGEHADDGDFFPFDAEDGEGLVVFGDDESERLEPGTLDPEHVLFVVLGALSTILLVFDLLGVV